MKVFGSSGEMESDDDELLKEDVWGLDEDGTHVMRELSYICPATSLVKKYTNSEKQWICALGSDVVAIRTSSATPEVSFGCTLSEYRIHELIFNYKRNHVSFKRE